MCLQQMLIIFNLLSALCSQMVEFGTYMYVFVDRYIDNEYIQIFIIRFKLQE